MEPHYTFIKCSIHLNCPSSSQCCFKVYTYGHTIRHWYLNVKRRLQLEEDGIFCSCSSSLGSSGVCGINCHCGMLQSSCSSECKCDSSCLNKPFDQRPVKKMKIVQTEKCGLGAVADEDIMQGDFVIEYVGEVIDDKTCEERLWRMKRQGQTNFYLCEINRDMVIDATYMGNNSRYMNHSCSPNTEMQKWLIGGETRIGIFATRDIRAGEHLSYDYQFVQFGAYQDCYCGALGCRGKLGVKPSKSKLPSSDTAVKGTSIGKSCSSDKDQFNGERKSEIPREQMVECGVEEIHDSAYESTEQAIGKLNNDFVKFNQNNGPMSKSKPQSDSASESKKDGEERERKEKRSYPHAECMHISQLQADNKNGQQLNRKRQDKQKDGSVSTSKTSDSASDSESKKDGEERERMEKRSSPHSECMHISQLQAEDKKGQQLKRKQQEKQNDNNYEPEIQKKQQALRKFEKIFSDEDEIKILKALLKTDYKTGSRDFLRTVKGSLKLSIAISSSQIYNKVRKLKKKYLKRLKSGKSNNSKNLHEHRLHKLSEKIWGNDAKAIFNVNKSEADEGTSDHTMKKHLGKFEKIFSDEDEIKILKALLKTDYKTGSRDFWRTVKGSLKLSIAISSSQIYNKVRKLKKKYLKRLKSGESNNSKNLHEHKLHKLSEKIWGNDAKAIFNVNKSEADEGTSDHTMKKHLENCEVNMTGMEVDQYAEKLDKLLRTIRSSDGSLSNFPVAETLTMISGSERSKLENKWNQLLILSLELYVRKISLIQEMMETFLSTFKGANSHRCCK